MTRVLASGVFDIIHPGHLHYLRAAKAHGDHLAVLVTSDGHAARSKRQPVHAEDERRALVAAIDLVDEAVVGPDPYDLARALETACPDVIALGYDQPFDPAELAEAAGQAGHDVSVVRIGKLPGTKLSTRRLVP
jgi:FAD synthetase